MKRLLFILVASALVCASTFAAHHKSDQMFAHIVFFTLSDSSDQAIGHLVEECQTYLKEHPGVLHFSAGKIAEEMDRDVNVQDFHVSLNVIFESKEAHDAYQVAPDHLTFIERNKANWAKVRVFDSYVK